MLTYKQVKELLVEQERNHEVILNWRNDIAEAKRLAAELDRSSNLDAIIQTLENARPDIVRVILAITIREVTEFDTRISNCFHRWAAQLREADGFENVIPSLKIHSTLLNAAMGRLSIIPKEVN